MNPEIRGSMYIPVSCDEAGQADSSTPSGRGRKRVRAPEAQSTDIDSESGPSRTRSGLVFMRSLEDSVEGPPNIVIEEDSPVVGGEEEIAEAQSQSSVGDNSSVSSSTEIIPGVDDGNHDENQEQGMNEEPDEDDSSADISSENDETENDEGGSLVFHIANTQHHHNDDEEEEAEDLTGEADDNNQQLEVRFEFQDFPTVWLDPLNDLTRWVGFANGIEVRESVFPVVDALLAGLLTEIIQFPFIDASKSDLVLIQESVIQACVEELSVLLPTDLTAPFPLGELIMRIPAIRQWEAGISAASAVCMNSVLLSSDQLAFARDQILIYRRFASSIGQTSDKLLSPVLSGILTSHFFFAPNEPPQLTTPVHPTLVCPFCRLMKESGSRRPSTIARLGEAVVGQIALMSESHSSDIDVRAMRLHAFDLARLVVAGDKGDEEFCDPFSNPLVEFIIRKFAGVDADSVLTDSERLTVLALATKCKASLSLELRRDLIPRLLLEWFFELSANHHFPVKLEVSQEPEERIVEETISALSTYDKIDFIFSNRVEVKFTGSRAVGVGPLNELLSKVLPQMFEQTAGLFAYSDSREVLMKPAPLPTAEPARSTHVRKLRQVGRLMALAIRREIVVGIYLTPGCLMQLISGGDEKILEMLEEEDPEKLSHLLKLRTSIEGVLGAPFPSGDDELNADNVELFILAHAKEQVLNAVEEQMRIIAMGIYDILPFGQLSWFLNPDEIRPLFEGNRHIDVQALKVSSTVSLPSTYRAGEVIPEIEWFWEIVDQFTPQLLADLLLFVSGSKFPPIHGFSGPRKDRDWLQISIDLSVPRNSLPRSQVCFVQLKLPRYTDKETMQSRLVCAITNCKTMERA